MNWFACMACIAGLQLVVMAAFLYVACDKLDLILYVLENAQ